MLAFCCTSNEGPLGDSGFTGNSVLVADDAGPQPIKNLSPIEDPVAAAPAPECTDSPTAPAPAAAPKEKQDAAGTQALAQFAVAFGSIDLGLTLDDGMGMADTVTITEVHKDGAAWIYNLSQEEDRRIKHGDQISEAGGHETASQILKYLQTVETPPKITITRPVEFMVTLTKSTGNEKLGLGITPSGKESLLCRSVSEGMVSAWNASNPDSAVKVGDRIVCVNGVRGCQQKLMTALSSSTTLEIDFSRHAKIMSP